MKKEEVTVKNKHVHIIPVEIYSYIFYYSRIMRYYHIQCMYDTWNSHSLARARVRVCVCVCVCVCESILRNLLFFKGYSRRLPFLRSPSPRRVEI